MSSSKMKPKVKQIMSDSMFLPLLSFLLWALVTQQTVFAEEAISCSDCPAFPCGVLNDCQTMGMLQDDPCVGTGVEEISRTIFQRIWIIDHTIRCPVLLNCRRSSFP